MTENKRARFADIKARLGIRVYTAAGPSGPIVEDQAEWRACVTMADVEWLIAEVERLQAVEAAVQRERDEGLVLMAHLVGRITYAEASECLGIGTVELLHMEQGVAALGAAVVRSRAEK